MFQGGPNTPVVLYRGTEEVAAADSGSGGLSTAAIIGIAVGGAVLVAAVAILVSIFVSRRRERAIDRAAKQRTMSRKQSSSSAGGEGESKWRAMYAQRMEDSMRRTEEAAARQSAAKNGPSFVEVQDREFQRQAAAEAKLTGPSISKKSCEF